MPERLLIAGLSMNIHGQNPNRPWLFFLHGFMGSGDIFDPIAEQLTPICNPVTVDLPGHGRSEGSTDPETYRTDLQVEWLNNALLHITSEKAHLYGYSMGGRLALQLAAAFPDHLSGLLLESTTPGTGQLQARKERRELDKERAQEIETDFPAFLEAWQAQPLFATVRAGQREMPTGGAEEETPAAIRGELRERYPRVMAGQEPGRLAASLRGFGTGTMPSVWSHLPQLAIPVQLLSGERDAKFSIIHQKMSRVLPNARHAVVSGAGHRVHTDRPDRLLSEIRTFIKSKK